MGFLHNLSYSNLPRSSRISKLAMSALFLSLATSPWATFPLSRRCEPFLRRYTWIQIPNLFWRDALFLSLGWAFVAIIRVYASRGKVIGLSVAWLGVLISLFWFVAIYLLLAGYLGLDWCP
jgi:hypothetical protein